MENAQSLVSVGYGKVNLSHAASTLSCMAMCRGSTKKVLPNSLYPRGGTVRFNVSNTPAVHGTLFLDTLVVPHGAILVPSVSRRYRGNSITDGALFVQTRADAPLIAVFAYNLPQQERVTAGLVRHVLFQGRADILNRDEIENLGYTVSPVWADTFLDPTETAQVIMVDTLASGANRPAFETFVTSEGHAVVAPARPRRQLRIKRD